MELRIILENKTEFKKDIQDKFQDFFGRVIADMKDWTTCGANELLITEALKNAFVNISNKSDYLAVPLDDNIFNNMNNVQNECSRVLGEIYHSIKESAYDGVCGLYEEEIAFALKEAFKKSKLITNEKNKGSDTVSILLTDELRAKFEIESEDSNEMIMEKIENVLHDKLGARFEVRCIKDVYGDDYAGDATLWSKDNCYSITYNGNSFKGECDWYNSGIESYLQEDDFLNSFKVKQAPSSVARYMCLEGYTDMFKDFLNDKDRKAVEKHFGCKLDKGNNDYTR